MADWLRQQTDVTIVKAPADPVAAVRDRKEDVVVVIDKDYAKNLGLGLPAKVKVISDSTRGEVRTKVRRVQRLIEGYSGQMASLRLMARGVSPVVARPLNIEDVEVSSAQQRLAQTLVVLPLLLVVALFVGTMGVAIDATAGERERGSLEPLLLNPVPRWTLAAGKWLASSAFGCASALVSMVLTVTAFRRIPWEDLGIRFRIADGDLMTLLALLLPLAPLMAGMVLFSATFARSFKEAQSSIGMLMLVPMMPGYVNIVYPLAGKPWLAPIPVLGQYALAADVLAGKPPGVGYFVLAGVAVIACSLGLVLIAARLLEREAVIFNK